MKNTVSWIIVVNMKKIFIAALYLILTVSLVWSISPESRLFEEAERRYRKGDYQFALSRYEKLIREYPASEYSADAHYRKGLILFRTGKAAEAVEYLTRVKNRYGYTRYAAYIPFWMGASYYALEEYESALDSFEAFLEERKDRYVDDALFYAALCRRELDRNEEALETVRRIDDSAQELFTNPQVFRLYADLLVETGRAEELLSAYREVPLEEAPEELQPSLSLYRAEALYSLGRGEEAEQEYRRLLEGPAAVSRIAYQRLFNLYLQNDEEEQRDRILEKAQTALAGSPRLLNEFYLRVGIESSNNGSYELAESYLRRVWRSVEPLQLNPLLPIYLSYAVEQNDGPEAAFELLEGYLEEVESEELEEIPERNAETGSSSKSGAGSVRAEPLRFAAVRLAAEAGRWERVEQYGKRYLELHEDSSHTGRVSYLYAFALRERGEARAALAVLEDLTEKREEGRYYGDILRLTAKVYMDLQRWTEAEEVLREYLPLVPAAPEAYIDLVRISFSRKSWEAVLDWASELREEVVGFESSYPQDHRKVVYLEGLARLGLKRYETGAEQLETLIEEGFVGQSEAEEIGPHLLFFAGWGRYKAADYRAAIRHFSMLEEKYPRHRRVQESRYLAGWAAFADNDYASAEESFAQYARFAESREERMKGLYMYAKSLSSGGNHREALSVYRQVFEDGGGSSVADDALFEYATLIAESGVGKEGRTEEAVDLYMRLYKSYPRSSLAEEALYRRGELLLDAERYGEAREAFYEHRSRFPEGDLVDVSLYWGAKAARSSGEPYGSALLLERLVDEYAESSLHSEALRELAELYDEVKDYEKAVRYYTRFRSLYPQQAEEFSVGRRIETLKEIMDGKSPREAELSVTVDEEGLDSGEGRSAAVELAGIYLNQYAGDREERQREALSLLRNVVERGEEGSRTTANAQYLIGEYYRREGEYRRAAKAYAEAAALSRGYDDLTARSMYMAAETADKAGDATGARQMVRKLQSDFPDSEWAAEGRRLLDEER